MTNPFNQGPQAPERNPPITPQYFQPSRFEITAITLGPTTTITTALNDNYVVGQLVRVLIPLGYGSLQLHGAIAYVVALPTANQVTINIDSTRNINAFIPTPTFGPTKPQLIPIGDINSGIISATGRNIPTTTIPGAFINISPL